MLLCPSAASTRCVYTLNVCCLAKYLDLRIAPQAQGQPWSVNGVQAAHLQLHHRRLYHASLRANSIYALNIAVALTAIDIWRETRPHHSHLFSRPAIPTSWYALPRDACGAGDVSH